MEQKLLDMRNISKTFGSVQALKGVSLDLYAGEVLALMVEAMEKAGYQPGSQVAIAIVMPDGDLSIKLLKDPA